MAFKDEHIVINSQDSHWNYILDEDFAKVFAPFRIFQKVLGTSRVDVKDGQVSAPTILQKCFTIICMVITSIAILSLLKTYSVRFSDSGLMFYLWMGGVSAAPIVFGADIVHARFFCNNGNVELYIRMQKIDRVMKTNRNINNKHYRHNRTTLLALTVICFTLMALALILAKDEFGVFELLAATYILMTFIFEVCSCVSLIRFFQMRVDLINSIIIRHFSGINLGIEILGKQSKTFELLIDIPTEWQDFETSATDIYIKEIFDGFSVFRDVYNFQIFLFCFTFVGWVLFTFKYAIFTLQNHHDMNKRFMLLDYLLLVSLALMELVLLLVLCVRSETFVREVRKTKQLSIFVMSRYADGPLRVKAKNMLKLIEESPPCFSVYGMWQMDAQLLLNIFNLITNLLVTIMQFTFV